MFALAVERDSVRPNFCYYGHDLERFKRIYLKYFCLSYIFSFIIL